jgi:hypothetical protein
MRPEGWEDRMAQAIAKHVAAPFSWGTSDCFMMPLDVAAAIMLTDPRHDDPPNYSDSAGARAELRRHGWETIADAFAAHFSEVHPAFARRGDIGIADYPGAVLGGGCVVIGSEIIGKGDSRTVRLPASALTRAFKVGW